MELNAKNSLHIEEYRLNTFTKWNIEFINKNVLALLGFYFLSPPDLVKCYFCKIEIGKWEPGDCVLSEHMQYSPNCALLRRYTTSNVPIDESILNLNLPPTGVLECRGRDVCGATERLCNVIERLDLNVDVLVKGSEYPEYNTVQARLDSFANWPTTSSVTPDDLSSAGFFYTGKSDKVLCFSCGGGFCNWEFTDNAMERHMEFYNKCSYVTSYKEFKKEPLKCKICYVNEIDTIFQPCGHVLACMNCTIPLKRCPICRRNCTIQKIFFV